MYKPVQPIRCPKCGTTVNVNTSMILTSNPPCYEWTCPNCGKKGYTKQGDIITFENQIGRATSGDIQKLGELNPDVDITATNANDLETIDIRPAIYSTNTKCIICGEEFGFDGEHRICPKCREAIVKLRKTTDSTANAMPTGNKSTVTDPKSTVCNIPAPMWVQQGWQCPKCGAILAPHQSFCPFCSKKESDWITTVGTGTQPFYGGWTNTPTSGRYTNPNTNTSISLDDKPRVMDSCTLKSSR